MNDLETMFYRKNLIIVGILLLVVFAGAVWLIGVQIDRTANRMHHSMVEELGKYRSELIGRDFRKTEELEESVRVFLEEKGYDREKLSQLLGVLVKLDDKVNRAWFVAGEDAVSVDRMGNRGVLLRDSLPVEEGSRLYREKGVLYWTLCGCNRGVRFGFDVALTELHNYFAGLVPERRSYAYIFNSSGVMIAHPDEKRVGQQVTDVRELERLKQVSDGKEERQVAVFSNFLLLPVERVYYPIVVGAEIWVVVVNVVQLDNQEAMSEFHRYTLFIALLTVVLFSILLVFSQYKWRKEYDLRVKAEQEAVQLNLQQLRNRLNPHFLFNALNSLNALIGHHPELAKEFVLNLSKVYRYVLEKRNENLVEVREEMQFARHYYFLQKIRFGEQLNLEISDGTEDVLGKIPAMSLQLLLENAVKHNEITREHPLCIRIYVKAECLVIENTYRPRTDGSSDSLGVGYESIREIYRYYSDKQFEYQVCGDQFVCSLPFL